MKFEIDGLVIEERPTGQEFYGEYVWPSALVMCDYLKRNPEIVKGKRVLELGSGTGIVGLYAAKLGAKHVTLTDFIDWNIEAIKRNIQENHLEKVADPRWLAWGTNLHEKWDVILGSDVTYPTMDYPALLNAVHTHLVSQGRCVFAHHHRPWACGPNLNEIETHEVSNLEVYSELVKSNCNSPKISIIEMEVQ